MAPTASRQSATSQGPSTHWHLLQESRSPPLLSGCGDHNGMAGKPQILQVFSGECQQCSLPLSILLMEKLRPQRYNHGAFGWVPKLHSGTQGWVPPSRSQDGLAHTWSHPGPWWVAQSSSEPQSSFAGYPRSWPTRCKRHPWSASPPRRQVCHMASPAPPPLFPRHCTPQGGWPFPCRTEPEVLRPGSSGGGCVCQSSRISPTSRPPPPPVISGASPDTPSIGSRTSDRL